jgi:hypothetical protein
MVDREALGGVRHTVIERIAAGNNFPHRRTPVDADCLQGAGELGLLIKLGGFSWLENQTGRQYCLALDHAG